MRCRSRVRFPAWLRLPCCARARSPPSPPARAEEKIERTKDKRDSHSPPACCGDWLKTGRELLPCAYPPRPAPSTRPLSWPWPPTIHHPHPHPPSRPPAPVPAEDGGGGGGGGGGPGAEGRGRRGAGGRRCGAGGAGLPSYGLGPPCLGTPGAGCPCFGLCAFSMPLATTYPRLSTIYNHNHNNFKFSRYPGTTHALPVEFDTA
jgi:hypothetical protein